MRPPRRLRGHTQNQWSVGSSALLRLVRSLRGADDPTHPPKCNNVKFHQYLTGPYIAERSVQKAALSHEAFSLPTPDHRWFRAKNLTCKDASRLSSLRLTALQQRPSQRLMRLLF